MEEDWSDDVSSDDNMQQDLSEESLACETIHRFLRYQEVFGVQNWLDYTKQSSEAISATDMDM